MSTRAGARRRGGQACLIVLVAGAAVLAHARDVLAAMPRTTIVAASPTVVHAEVRSRLFGFVDDVELVLDEAAGRIDVRAASRVGYSDLGVNRRRVEAMRTRLRERPEFR